MPVSDEYLDYILDQLADWGDVSVRRMFGGAGLYRDGKMFALVADNVLYLKVDESNRRQFEEAGCGPFQPYPDKPTTMSYYRVPADVLEDPEQLIEWARQSLAIQKESTSPGKRRP